MTLILCHAHALPSLENHVLSPQRAHSAVYEKLGSVECKLLIPVEIDKTVNVPLRNPP